MRFAREIRAHARPVHAAINRLPEIVVAEEQHVRIRKREHHRQSPHRAERRTRCRARRCRGRQARRRRDVRHLRRAPVVARDLSAVHDVRIERIGRRVAVLLHRDRMPLAHRDVSVVAAARDAHRSAVLLPAADAVRKRVVGHHVVERRRRLRVPRAPRRAAIQRHDAALIRNEQDDVRVVRIDPGVLVVVSAGRTFERHERLRAVGGLVRDDVGHDQRVGILGIDDGHRLVRAVRGTHVRGRARPRVARVVRSIDSRVEKGAGGAATAAASAAATASTAGAGSRARSFNQRIQSTRIARRDRHLGVDDVGQAVPKLRPRLPAVGRFEDAAAGAAPRAVLPRPLAFLPQRRVDDVGIRGIDIDVLAAGVGILVEDFLKRLPAVERSKDAALFVRAVRMPERGHENPIGIARIDDDLRNLLRIAQSRQMRPRLTSVRGFVDAVADREIRARQPLTARDVHDVRIGWRDRHPSDRSGRLIVEERLPRAAGVRRLPHAAVADADVERVRLARHAGRRPWSGLPAAARCCASAGRQRAPATPARFAVQVTGPGTSTPGRRERRRTRGGGSSWALRTNRREYSARACYSTMRTVQKSSARLLSVRYAYGIVKKPFLPQPVPHEFMTMKRCLLSS